MAKIGMVAAARAAGVSRATLHRYVKSGKVTATKGRDGKAAIDTAELMRVFGELQHPETSQKASLKRSLRPRDTVADTSQEVVSLRREIERLEAECERLRRELADERNDRRELQSLLNRRQLTAPGPGLVSAVAKWFGVA